MHKVPQLPQEKQAITLLMNWSLLTL